MTTGIVRAVARTALTEEGLTVHDLDRVLNVLDQLVRATRRHTGPDVFALRQELRQAQAQVDRFRAAAGHVANEEARA